MTTIKPPAIQSGKPPITTTGEGLQPSARQAEAALREELIKAVRSSYEVSFTPGMINLLNLFEALCTGSRSDYVYTNILHKLRDPYTLRDLEALSSSKRVAEHIIIGEHVDEMGLFFSAAVNRIIKAGDTVTLSFRAPVDSLGAHFERGTLVLNGNVGNHIATDMVGGLIIIRGNVGDFLALGMSRRARIEVHGNAGHSIGVNSDGGTIEIGGTHGRKGTHCKAHVITPKPKEIAGAAQS